MGNRKTTHPWQECTPQGLQEEAEIVLYGSYREIATAKNLQRSPTMESKKKLSIDKIRQFEHQKNF
jgi:hypothetical protein